ncbi:MAG: FAD-binding oxidoreductase [Alphaproteobacteria bacterium]|nr:FAD-binding oxidoreductase [Alphaproteobacteria bacterium]
MKNLYHSDMYQFNYPVKSYWEDTTKVNLNLEKLTKDINCEIVIIGGGYTGLSCAINLIKNYQLDVILVEAGKLGWGASSRNAGFCSFPPSKLTFDQMVKKYGKKETKNFYFNSIESAKYTRTIISEYNIDCDITGDANLVVAHHPKKFNDLKEQAELYKNEFGLETKIYSKDEFEDIGHGGTEQFGAFSYKPGFALNPIKFLNGMAQFALSQKLKIFQNTFVNKIEKNLKNYILRTKEGSINAKKIVIATNGFYQEGLIPQLNSRVLPVISNIILTRKLTDQELKQHNFKTFNPIVNTKNLLAYYRKLKDNRILFGMRGDLKGSDQSSKEKSKNMEKQFKLIFPKWVNVSIEYSWRGFIALSQKLAPSIGKIDQEEIYFSFGYNGVGVGSAPWSGKQLSKLVFSSNSKVLEISKIYQGLPKKFIFPSLRLLYLKFIILYYALRDKLNM